MWQSISNSAFLFMGQSLGNINGRGCAENDADDKNSCRYRTIQCCITIAKIYYVLFFIHFIMKNFTIIVEEVRDC